LQQRPTMKVLFMSGHSDNVITGPDHQVAAGADFIQKPFGAEELFRRLRAMLDRHAPENAA
jgi:DNA-binding response OmpR family regulator